MSGNLSTAPKTPYALPQRRNARKNQAVKDCGKALVVIDRSLDLPARTLPFVADAQETRFARRARPFPIFRSPEEANATYRFFAHLSRSRHFSILHSERVARVVHSGASVRAR